ncbi:endonuclease domain-containing protein [Sanguibacter sp. HDW7]|uniref:endonuclease domain-containing protein n=1 Tax=Sanguibacter sp. HDW7 TaxID=2714931 RepID=UPI00140BC2BD|nr:DUF559 domain-containing protein [Sanguibacter sp. HDW7]QIK84261.1 DUF559 domain-containing protein [Sanguibacter sp. HDW7]
MTRRQVDHRLSRGIWRYVVAGVIAHRDHVVTATDLVLAAGLVRPGCLVVGRVAAAYHGVPVPLRLPVAIQVDSPGRSVPSGFVGRMVTVDAPGILRVGGIARVAPDRWSYVDALATMPWDDVRNLYAYLVTHARLGPEHLREHLAAHPHRRGNGQLRELLRRSASGALSEAEELMHALLRRAGITGWEANTRIDLPGLRVRPDVVFRAARVVIEVDGRRTHASRLVADHRRDAALTAAGWTVVRVTWWDLVERPDALIAQIRQILTR